MDAAEERMWWYRAAHTRLLDALRRGHLPQGGRLLDAGCGTGGLLRRLRSERPDLLLLGVDRDGGAAERAREKAGVPVAVASVDDLPFADASLDAIVSADVLYHRAVDEGRALAEAYRCLRHGGLLVVNVPAFRWLSSFHDRQVHGARRYTRAEIVERLRDARFAEVEAGYWNSLLFPIMVLRRKLFPSSAEGSDVVALPGLLESVFGMVMSFERRTTRMGVRYPFGGSVMAVAVK